MKQSHIHQSILIALQRIEKKVDSINTKSNLDKDYLSTREACSFLSCSRTMLWNLVKAGKIERRKLENGRTYYSTHELKNIIEAPAAETEAA